MKEFASLVADGSSGFDDEQAASRVGELDAAAAVFASDIIMIGRWIVGVQAQSKTAFTCKGAMATATVATGL